MDLTSFYPSTVRRLSIWKTCDFDYTPEKEDKILKTLLDLVYSRFMAYHQQSLSQIMISVSI